MNQSRKDKNQLQENQNDYNFIINFLSKVFTNTFDTKGLMELFTRRIKISSIKILREFVLSSWIQNRIEPHNKNMWKGYREGLFPFHMVYNLFI